MGFQIIAKKRFLKSFKKITSYLKKEWDKSVAEEFKKIVSNKLDLIALQPNIGANTAIKIQKVCL